jgi:hypothetical protein
MDKRRYPRPDIIHVHFPHRQTRSLTQHWSIWLTKRDPERALKVRSRNSSSLSILVMLTSHALTPKDTNKRGDNKPKDDSVMLLQVSKARCWDSILGVSRPAETERGEWPSHHFGRWMPRSDDSRDNRIRICISN